jgi:hypothetical protein
MKGLLFVMALFLAKSNFAQIPYTDFIQSDTAIQWAAEYDQILNITPKIARFGIRNIIHAKLMRGECINNYKISYGNVEKTKFCLNDTISRQNSFTSSINPFSKTSYALVEEISAKKLKTQIFKTFEEKNNKGVSQIFKLKQILSYKDAKLAITNILVTPLFLKNYFDSNGLKLTWETNYNTCFNDSLKILTAINKTNLIDLSTNYQIYNLFYDSSKDALGSKIITNNKPILSQQLLNDIKANKITAVDDYGNIINWKSLLYYKATEVTVPIFVDGGKNEGMYYSKIMKSELNIDSIYKFGINQQFYYDTLNNILHSYTNYIDVYKQIIGASGLSFGEMFFFRIYFIKPSQYKKRPSVLFKGTSKMRLSI